MSSTSVAAGGVRERVLQAARGLRWYLREFTGEARWDDYLARCEAEGRPPMSRFEFERHRADQRERCTHSRCC